MATKKALVLSGGSIKGAFQAGAVKAVLETGYAPEIITGISVGSLNGTMIANEVGRFRTEHSDEEINWPNIGQYVYNFWKDNITSPKKLAKKRGFIPLVEQIISGKFKGLTDTKPIDTLIDDIARIEYIRASGIELAVGTVNLVTAKIIYAEPKEDNFLDYLKGSKAIPIAMSHVDIVRQPFLDGGLRDSAPLNQAINKGATEVICILCHSKDLAIVRFNPGKLGDLADRLANIHSNETCNNDIEWAEYINQFVPEDGSPKLDEPFKDMRKIDIKTIRPKKELTLEIGDFTSDDIVEHMNLGYDTAKEELESNPI